MSSESNKFQIPDWIKELQENSWRLELLISGGAIFTLFQLEDIFIDYMMRLKMTAHMPGTGILIILGMLAIKLLTLGFLSHLLLRTYWLGLLCVNYVFPKGISGKKVSYQKPFQDKYGEGESLQTEIHKVDNASGLVMFFSVLTTMVIAGFLLLTAFLLTFPKYLSIGEWYFGFSILLILFYHLDLFLFGLFRKIPYLTYLTFPIFWLFDRISLRVFYQKSLRMFSSNVSKVKTFFSVLTAVAVGLFFTYNAIYKVMHWPYILDSREHRWTMAKNDVWVYPGFYRDSPEIQGEKIYGPSIQSDVITGNYLKLIVPYDVDYDDRLDSDQYLEEGGNFFIDDSLYEIEWFNYRPFENDQLGMKAVIDIFHLSRGKHELRIENAYGEEEHELIIPFWKD